MQHFKAFQSIIQHFKHRTCRNLSIIPLTWKKVKTPKANGIFDHIIRTGQNPSFDDFETFVKDFNEFRLSTDIIWWAFFNTLGTSIILIYILVTYYSIVIVTVLIIRPFNVFRWGTFLYMSNFPSVRSSVAHHISGTVHDLMMIFGTYM